MAMTRRMFAATLVGLLSLPWLSFKRTNKVGLMTVERWFAEGRQHQSVLLNGRDITNGCVWFDDRSGEAERLKCDSRGEFYVKDGGFAREMLRGHIEVIG